MRDRVPATVELSGVVGIGSIRGSFKKIKEAIGANKSREIEIADVRLAY
jgi:hypothetical protein